MEKIDAVKDAMKTAVIDIVRDAAVDRDAIVEALLERGIATGTPESVRQTLDRGLLLDTSFEVVADGTVHVPSILEGTVWTVWVDPDDAAEGFIRTHPHLIALGWWLIGGDVRVVDESGAVIGIMDTDGILLDDRDTDVVIVPSRLLQQLSGGWATVTVIDGALRWARAASPTEPEEPQVAAILRGFDRDVNIEERWAFETEPPDHRFTGGESVILEALVAERAAFVGRPIAPLPELFRAAGLEERSHHTLAEAGFDWEALEAWRMANRMRRQYGFDADQTDLLTVTMLALEAQLAEPVDRRDDSDELAPSELQIVAAMEDSDVASAFWDACLEREIAIGDITQFALNIADRPNGATSPGMGWLLSRCLDRMGEPVGAERMLISLVDGGSSHQLVLEDGAGFAADRGDAVTAHRLLLQAGVELLDAEDEDEDPSPAQMLLLEVAGWATHRPPQTARRNDPCPCGSGRKYKACHIGREQFPLADRSIWLYEKAKRFLRSRAAETAVVLAETIADEDPDMFDELLEMPIVTDLALHEGGVFDEFLTARSVLLPDDEALLAAQWALVDRSVFEVVGLGKEHLELRDVRTGDAITVVNVTPSATGSTQVGSMLLGRPLPVGDTYRALAGFVSISPRWAPLFLEAIELGDAEAVAEVYSMLFAPPTLTNTDGHDLEAHTMHFQVPDLSAVPALLAAAGLEQIDDEPRWHVVQPSKHADGPTIVATLQILDGELIGDVNSAERADMLDVLVMAAIPGAELFDDEVATIADIAAARDQGPAPTELDQTDPAIREMLATHIAAMERRWIDESIPALGGRTPRECVLDPIGREQVIQLLASFPIPDADQVGAMNPDRLRAALGI